MSLSKMKVYTVILSGTLVLALGTATAFATGANEKLLVRSEDGKKSYSVDGGQTWGDTAPEGIREYVGQEGKVRVFLDEDSEIDIKRYAAKEGSGYMLRGGNGSKRIILGGEDIEGGRMGLMVKIEDDVKMYSEDGGLTWSENIPDGYTINEDIEIELKGDAAKDGSGYMLRGDNGTKRIFVRCGADLEDDLPEGSAIFKRANQL